MNVHFYSKRVQKDYMGLAPDFRACFTACIKRMHDMGTWNIGMPFVRHMTGTPLYEIRLHGKSGIARTLFVAIETSELMILHAFVKKDQKTPRKEIDLALQRWKEMQHG